MADIYIDESATGAADGSSWDDAYTSIDFGSTAAGDVLYVASSHDENINSTTGHVNLANGTFGAPVKLISATAGSDPPEYAAGATFRMVSNKVIYPGTNNVLEVWGCVWRADASGADMLCGYGADSITYFFNCTFHVKDRFYTAYSADARTLFSDCTLNLDASTGDAIVNGQRSSIDWRGGTITGGQLDYLINDAYGAQASFRAVDISGYTEGVNPHPSNKGQQLLISGCNVGADFSLTDVESTDGTDAPDQIMIAEYCGTGTITAPVEGLAEKLDFGGRTTIDTARYRNTGGRSAVSNDQYSHALKSRSSYGTEMDGHRSVDLVARCVGGAEVTATVYVASGGTIYDDELWFDLFGPSEGTTAQQHYHTTRKANPTATRAALTTDSTSTWSGSGVGTMQKISHSWTPAQDGIVRVELTWAKGGGSWVYVDPKLEVS